MCRTRVLATVALFLLGQMLTAQDLLILRDMRLNCRTRMTEICRVPTPLSMPRMVGDGTGAAPGQQVVLQCSNWQGGRHFTDQNGQRWQLVSPVPMRQNPVELRGMIFRGPDGTAVFMTPDKLVFVELGAPADGPAPAAAPMPGLLRRA